MVNRFRIDIRYIITGLVGNCRHCKADGINRRDSQRRRGEGSRRMRICLRRITATISISLLLCFMVIEAHGRTWHVRSDQSGDAPTVQAAIDSSAAGDTVLVASGNYYIEGTTFCFEKSDLKILGQEGSDPVAITGTADRNDFIIDACSYIVLRGFVFSNCPLNITWSAPVLIENNIFKNLSPVATEGGGDIEIRDNLIYSCGTGIFCSDYGSNITIHNNVIALNRGEGSYYDGCGILLDAGSFTVYNNIITSNISGIISIATTLNLSCNDVWGNEAFNYDLTYVPDPTGTNGNISLDPQFCGVAPEISGNFFLQSDSPCAAGNHPDGVQCGLIGKHPVGCGPTSVENKTWGKIKSIFR
jgi:hypothetical protein